MVLASIGVLKVEAAPQNGCYQHLCTQGESQLPSAPLGGSPRSAGRSDLESFHITASVLGLRTCEILHVTC